MKREFLKENGQAFEDVYLAQGTNSTSRGPDGKFRISASSGLVLDKQSEYMIIGSVNSPGLLKCKL